MHQYLSCRSYSSNLLTIPHMAELLTLKLVFRSFFGCWCCCRIYCSQCYGCEKISPYPVPMVVSIVPSLWSRGIKFTSWGKRVNLLAISYGPTCDEMNSLQFRRSIYVSSDIQPGESSLKHTYCQARFRCTSTPL